MSDTSTRENRRSDLVDAALEAFIDRGYEGTSVAQLAEATNLSKAAFVYHFGSKEKLLVELATPLLDDLDEVVDRHDVGDPDLSALLNDYLDVLCHRHDVASWVDGDKSVLNHGELGDRLDANNRRVHRMLSGPRPTKAARARASAILGMMWRPVRNGYLTTNPEAKAAVVELAQAAVNMLDSADVNED